VELKGSSNNIRVRQLQVLAEDKANQDLSIPAAVAQQRACEMEALQIFRLLTSQVIYLYIHCTYCNVVAWHVPFVIFFGVAITKVPI